MLMVYILRILILMAGKLLIKSGQLFLGDAKVENENFGNVKVSYLS